MPRLPSPPGDEHPILDVAAFKLAIDAVIAQRRITAGQVAAESGVPAPIISNLRKHNDIPSLNNVLALCRWLGLPLERYIRPQAGVCSLCGAGAADEPDTVHAGAA